MDDHPKTPLQAAPIHLLSKKPHKPCVASNDEIKLQLLSSYRKTAFLSILLSTATTLICGVTIPWAYSYVQYVDTVLTSQMDYCMHETTELWRLFSSTTTPTSEHVDINNPDVIQYRTTRSTGVTRKALLIKAGRRFRRLGLSTFSDRQKDSLADKWQITGFWHFGKFFPPYEEIIEREQQKEKQRENELRKRQVPEFEQTEAPRFWGSNPRLDRHLRDFFRHYHSLKRKHEFLMNRSGRDPRRSESYPSLLNRRAIPPFDSFFENSRGNSRPPTSSPKDIVGRPIPSTMAPKPETERRFSRQPTSGRFGGTLIQERLPVDLAPANAAYNPSTTAIPVSGYVDREAPAPPTIRPEHFSLSYARPAPTKYRPTYPQTQTTTAYPGPAQKPISPSPLTGNGRNPRPGAFVSGGSGVRQQGSSGCCTCHQGPAGPPGRPGVPGHNGRDGKSGIDGPPGLDGDELLEFTRRTQQNGYVSKPCVPTCEPALPGLPGYPGYKGRKGPRGDPGDPGYGGKEGPPGERGQAGSKGKHGKRGLPGIPGIPGEITVGRLPAGQPGPQGRPGPYGAAGLPGFDGKAALPGKPGPRGPVGETGAPGTPGDYGRPGPTGLRGTVGDCSHCPPPRFPPGYFVEQTLPVEHISPAGPPPLPNFPPTPAPRRDTVAPMPATYPPTAAPPSWIPTPTTVAPLYPATRAPPPELEYAAPPRTAPPGNTNNKNNGYASPLGTVAPPPGSGHHTVPGTTRRYSSNSAEWLNLLREQQQQQQPSREITQPLGLPVPRPPNALFNVPPTGAFEVVYDDVPAGIPHEWDMYSHAMQHNPFYGHVPWYQSIYSRRQLGVPGFEKSKS